MSDRRGMKIVAGMEFRDESRIEEVKGGVKEKMGGGGENVSKENEGVRREKLYT